MQDLAKQKPPFIYLYFPEEVQQESKKRKDKKDNDAEIALAIAAAIHKGAGINGG